MIKSKFINKIFKIKDYAIFLMFLIAAAFPIGSMNGVEVESSYKILFSFIKGLIDKNADDNFAVFFIYSLVFLLIGAGHITFLKCYSTTKLSKVITRIVCYFIILLAFIITSNINFKFFGLTSSTITVAIIALVVNMILIPVEFIINRKLERAEIKEPANESSADENKIDDSERQTTEQTDAMANVIQSVPDKKRIKWTYNYSGIVFSAIAFLIFCIFLIPTKPNGDYYYFGHDYASVVSNSLGDSYFGSKELDKNFLENFYYNFKEGEYKTYNYHSSNYTYWQNKAEEKRNEIKKLMPESSSESDLKKYAEKIKKLQEEINIINEKLATLNYENIRVTTVSRKETYKDNIMITNEYFADIIEIVYDTQYNSGSSSTVKWNNKKNLRLFCKQSIKLTQTEFKENTDFSSVKIGATINYYDGSIKKSYIKVDNYRELNNASKGEHTLKWSDKWGSYEYKITIT